MKVTGAGGSDIVISNADAQGLRDVTKNLSFLEQCRALESSIDFFRGNKLRKPEAALDTPEHHVFSGNKLLDEGD